MASVAHREQTKLTMKTLLAVSLFIVDCTHECFNRKKVSDHVRCDGSLPTARLACSNMQVDDLASIYIFVEHDMKS